MCQIFSNLNNVGLLFDIIGVILMFIFGVPKHPFFSRTNVVITTNEDKNKYLERILSSLEYIGLLFLIIGFGLQIYSTTIT